MRRTHLTATALVAVALVALAVAATVGAAGGLSIEPAVLERVAATGRAGDVTVANRSARPVRVTVRTRPWRQARNGTVVADTSRTLASRVRATPASFTLAPGQRRAIAVSLRRRPPGNSLYGALEVVGTPQGAVPRGAIRTRYRLIGALRLNPPVARHVLKVRVVRVRSSGRRILVTLRNDGNTASPISGSAVLTGGAGTQRTSVPATRILPGRTVDVSLRAAKPVPGRYTATITLRQGGRTVANVRRALRVH